MVNKKGYMKILEAVIAIVILLLFITVLAIQNRESEPAVPQDISLLQDTIVNGIKSNDTLRQFVLSGDVDSVNNSINSLVPSGYDYNLVICDLVSCGNPVTSGLDQPVYVETFLITGGAEKSLVSLYLWRIVES